MRRAEHLPNGAQKCQSCSTPENQRFFWPQQIQYLVWPVWGGGCWYDLRRLLPSRVAERRKSIPKNRANNTRTVLSVVTSILRASPFLASSSCLCQGRVYSVSSLSSLVSSTVPDADRFWCGSLSHTDTLQTAELFPMHIYCLLPPPTPPRPVFFLVLLQPSTFSPW